MMKTKAILSFVLLVVVLALAGCASQTGSIASNVQVESPWIRAAANGGNTAAFMVIKNTTAQEDKLIKAEAAVSGKVVLMSTEKKDGKMQMVNVDTIVIPASGQQELKSGSFHVMFMGLTKDLNDGDTVQVTLTFEKGGTIKLDIPVKKPTT